MVAQVRPWAGVADYDEVQPSDRTAVRSRHSDRCGGGDHPGVLAQRGAHVERVGRRPAAAASPLDFSGDGGIKAEAGREQKPATLGAPDRDDTPRAGAEPVKQNPDRRDRLGGQADGAGEYVGRAGRHYPEERNAGVGTIAEQTVGDLVDSAVTAHGHHGIGTVIHRVAGELDRMAAPAGLHHFYRGRRGERLGDGPAAGGRRRRGARVGDNHDAHGCRHYRPVTSDPVKRAQSAVAGELRLAVILVLAQASGLLAGAVFVAVQTASRRADDVGRALSDAGFAVAGAAILILLSLSILRLTPAARTPLVVLELLALPVGYSLAFPSARPGFGAPVLLSALAVLYLLFTPGAREQLQR